MSDHNWKKPFVPPRRLDAVAGEAVGGSARGNGPQQLRVRRSAVGRTDP